MVRADHLSFPLTCRSDFGFEWDLFGDACVPAEGYVPYCEPGTVYYAPSGYRMIAGDTCEGGLELDKPVLKECDLGGGSDPNPTVPPGQVGVSKVRASILSTFADTPQTVFDSPVVSRVEFDNSNVLVWLLKNGDVMRSDTQGIMWHKCEIGGYSADGKVMFAVPNRIGALFILTGGRSHLYSRDFGSTFVKFDVPLDVDIKTRAPEASFLVHPKDESQWLFSGSSCTGSRCRTDVYYTANKGGTWRSLAENAPSCVWTAVAIPSATADTIHCVVDGSLQRYTGSRLAETIMDKALAIVPGDGYVAVATVRVVFCCYLAAHSAAQSTGDEASDFFLSSDGRKFMDAELPKDVSIDNKVR